MVPNKWPSLSPTTLRPKGSVAKPSLGAKGLPKRGEVAQPTSQQPAEPLLSSHYHPCNYRAPIEKVRGHLPEVSDGLFVMDGVGRKKHFTAYQGQSP